MSDAFDGAWDVLKARRPTSLRRNYRRPTQTTAGAPAANQDVGQPVPPATQNVDVMEQQRMQEAQRMNQLRIQDPAAYQKILLERAYAKNLQNTHSNRMQNLVNEGMRGTPMEKAFIFLKEGRKVGASKSEKIAALNRALKNPENWGSAENETGFAPKCAACGNSSYDGARFCKKCSTMEKAFIFLKEMRLRTDLPDNFQMNPETSNTMLDCAACGNPSYDGTRFCRNCSKDYSGKRINPTTTTSRVNTQLPPTMYSAK